MVSPKVNSILLSLVMCLILFQTGWAEEPKSNEKFLRDVVAQLLNQSFSQVLPQIKDTVYFKEEGGHPASWLLGEELIFYLSQNNKEVFLFDSTKFRYPDTTFLENTRILNYRLTELRVHYPKVKRKGFLGKKVITREGKVTAFFYLVNAANGEILWQSREEKKGSDKFDASELKKVENKDFPFLWADLPSSATKKYVEPAIVTAVAGGLIYLFFANR